MHSESPFESFLVWLFLACGWYGTLGRVVNFEPCHLRSLGRVANFKNDAFPNGGIGFDLLASLTCCTCCRMIIGGGWGGCINILDEHFPYGTEHVHVAHAVVWSSGGWGGVLTSFTSTSFTFKEHGNTSKNCDLCRCHTKKQQCTKKKDTLGPTAGHGVTTSPCCSLWLLRCHKRSGTEASRRGKNWMSEYRPDMIRMIENHRILMFFFTLEEQNRVTVQAKR